MQVDEEFRNLIPKLSNEEFKQLEESIIKEGCREPIIVWNDTIIDGHNRYEICMKHNIDFKTMNKTFSTRDETKAWIIKNQLGRRNLGKYERTILAIKLENSFKEKAKENQILAGENFGKGCQKSDKAIENEINPIDTKKEIAKIAETSHDTIAKVKKIEEKAPEEIKEKVKNGELSINQAYANVKMQEDLEKYIKDNCNEQTETEEQEKLREQREKELSEMVKQRKIQQHFMKTIGDSMFLENDNEHIEAWFSDLSIEEIQKEISDTEKAVQNLTNLITEAKLYLSKNKFKVVK